MKRIAIPAFVLLVLAFAYPSCDEVGPAIDLGKNSKLVSEFIYTEGVAQPEPRNVVIEEFTGVRCINCPQGHQVIEDIKAQHPGRVISISLHPVNSLGIPYPNSPIDFRDQRAHTIFDYLGQIGSEPAASINRRLFTGESAILMDRGKWTGYASQELNEISPVNLKLEKVYDSISHRLTVTVEVHYTKTVTEENKLTLLIAESNLIAPQLNGPVIDTFYVHKDVMRDFITDVKGDLITSDRRAGTVVKRVYRTTLDVGWKLENLQIIGFVHQHLNSKAIYQGEEINVAD